MTYSKLTRMHHLRNLLVKLVYIDIMVRDGEGNELATKRMQPNFPYNPLLVGALDALQAIIFDCELGLRRLSWKVTLSKLLIASSNMVLLGIVRAV